MVNSTGDFDGDSLEGVLLVTMAGVCWAVVLAAINGCRVSERLGYIREFLQQLASAFPLGGAGAAD